MCAGPTFVVVITGAEGAIVSAGSVALTVLLFLDLFPAASKAYTKNEYVPMCCRPAVNVTKVADWGTLTLCPLLHTTLYVSWPELSDDASQARDTLQAVFPVTFRLFGLVGGLLSAGAETAATVTNTMVSAAQMAVRNDFQVFI